jgi:hypothetical protein
MAASGKSGLGNVSDNDTKYNIHLGGSGADDRQATKVLNEVFTDRGLEEYVQSSDSDSADLTMDLTSPTAMVNYYEGL